MVREGSIGGRMLALAAIWRCISALNSRGLRIEAHNFPLVRQLHSEDTRRPIATHRRPRTNHLDKTSTPVTFSMTARAQEIEETCVVSLLFLEKRRRMETEGEKTHNVRDCNGRRFGRYGLWSSGRRTIVHVSVDREVCCGH